MGFSDFYETIKIITISEILAYSSDLQPIGVVTLSVISILSILMIYWLGLAYRLFSRRGFGFLFSFFAITSFWTALTLNQVLFFVHTLFAYGFFSSMVLLQIVITLATKNRKVVAIGLGVIAINIVSFVAIFILCDYRLNGIEEVAFILTTNVWLSLISLFTVKKEIVELKNN